MIAAAKTVTTCPEETKVPFSPFEITTSAELPGIPTVIPEMIRLLIYISYSSVGRVPHWLDQQMPSYPQDHYLQMFRGYFLKNEAMSLRDLGDAAGFDRSLAKADRVFQTIRAEAELYLSNAYNGLGSVTLLQAAAQRSKRQGKQALQWIDKALALVPNHPYALHDRQETLRFLGGRPRA